MERWPPHPQHSLDSRVTHGYFVWGKLCFSPKAHAGLCHPRTSTDPTLSPSAGQLPKNKQLCLIHQEAEKRRERDVWDSGGKQQKAWFAHFDSWGTQGVKVKLRKICREWEMLAVYPHTRSLTPVLLKARCEQRAIKEKGRVSYLPWIKHWKAQTPFRARLPNVPHSSLDK